MRTRALLLEGYRRLTFMMLDDDIVAVSPATVYRVLRAAGRLDRNRPKPTKKGTGFVQPFGPHVHWHVDIAVITIAKTYYYLCSVLDGYSRYVVHWEFLDRMTEADIEFILQRALEAHPGARPRIISDNGPQFIAGDFRRFINLGWRAKSAIGSSRRCRRSCSCVWTPRTATRTRPLMRP